MKISYNVRTSDMDVKEGVEVNVDTVYDRQNITEIVNDDGIKELNIGIETEQPLREYIEGLLQTDVGQTIIAENTTEVMETVSIIAEMQAITQAQTNSEMMDLIMSLVVQGGDI